MAVKTLLGEFLFCLWGKSVRVTVSIIMSEEQATGVRVPKLLEMCSRVIARFYNQFDAKKLPADLRFSLLKQFVGRSTLTDTQVLTLGEDLKVIEYVISQFVRVLLVPQNESL